MPFDGLDHPASKPSIPALIAALRDPALWPADFIWDFMLPCNCAMGLAQRLWPAALPALTPHRVADALGMNFFAAMYVFLGQFLVIKPGLAAVDVQPEHVAEQLELYLAAEDAFLIPRVSALETA